MTDSNTNNQIDNEKLCGVPIKDLELAVIDNYLTRISELRQEVERLIEEEPQESAYFDEQSGKEDHENWTKDVRVWKLFADELENGLRALKARFESERAQTGTNVPFDEIPTFEVFGTPKIEEIETTIKKEFDGLNIQEIVDKERALIEGYREWRKQLDASKPKREDWGAIDSYEHAVEDWKMRQGEAWQKKNQEGESRYELARAKIDVIMRAKPVSNAADAECKIDRFWERKLGEERAWEATEETQRHANNCYYQHEHYAARYNPLKVKWDRLKGRFKNAVDDERDQILAELQQLLPEYNQAIRRLNELKHEPDEEKIKRGNWREPATRQYAIELLQELFPDNGGTTVFSQSFRDSVLQTAETAGYRAEAQDAFDFYDIIMRSYNTGGRNYRDPHAYGLIRGRKTMTINGNSVEVGGSYNHITGDIQMLALNRPVINENDDAAIKADKKRRSVWCGNFYRTAGVHELAHHLDSGVLGAENANENVEWVLREQNARIPRNRSNAFTVPSKPGKINLTVNEEDYAQTIVPHMARTGYVADAPDSSVSTFNAGEVLSVGMEYLAADPETFIRRCPEHFNRVLANLEKLSKNQ